MRTFNNREVLCRFRAISIEEAVALRAEGAQLSINTITKETVIFLTWIEIVWGILLEELMLKGFMTPMIFEVKIARCRKRAKATEKRNPRVREN